MRRFGRTCALSVFGLVLGLSTSTSTAGEKDVPLNKVPKAVVDAFKAKFPAATIKNSIEEDNGGKITYEIESTVAGGLSIDAVLKPNGEFVAIEKQIAPSELPAAVTAGAKAKYPRAAVEKAEEVLSDGKTSYEVTVKKDDGKTSVLVFDKEGKFLEEE